MNAIDQYVAPPPPRPDQQQTASSSARSSTDGNGGPSFGDVYNRSANNNQSDQQNNQSTDQTDQSGTDTGQAENSTKPASDKSSSESKVSSVIFKLVGEAASAATSGTTTTAAKDKSAKTTTADDVAQAMEDATDALAKAALAAKNDKKDATKAADGKADTQAGAEAQAAAQDADNAAELLKLLGAHTGTETKGKKTDADTEIKQTGTEKDKQVDAKDKSEDTTANTTDNVLQVASVAVEAVGNRPSNQDDQSGKKSGDQAPSDASALKSVGTETTQSSDKVPGTEADKPSKTETVTVLESRRFVGSGEGLSSNTQALISGMKGDSDWAAAMKAASAANTNVSEQRTATPVNTLKIQMTPENLGNVTATLRLHGDQLTVHLSVESADAFKQLSSDKDGLVQSLKSQGFTVDQVSVQMAPSSADKSVAQSSSGQQTGGQQQGGQQMQDGSAGQFAQQRGQENNRRQQENGFTTNWQADDRRATVDSGSVASDSPRTGQVYL